MLEGLRRLVDLQRIDVELARAREEIASLPGRRAEAHARREAAEQRVAGAHEALEEAERDRRRVEAELGDREVLLRRLQGQTSQVKTNAAYTALLHEIDQTRQSISDCETRILERMEEIETGGSTLERLEAERDAVRGGIAEEERELDARARRLEQELARAEEHRAKLAESLEASLLEQYEMIARHRRPAVAIAARELCMGCRVGIPPQKYIEVLRGESIVSCGSCRRILVHESLLGAAEGGGGRG